MSTELPIATATNVGGMKTGSDIAVSNEGVAATSYAGRLALDDDYITIGGGNAETTNSVVIGAGATVSSLANDIVVVGFNGGASYAQSVACGSQAQTSAPECVAIGYQAQASNHSSVALGMGSVTSDDFTVSIGNGTLDQPLLRRLANVDDAQDPTDAINLRQMQEYVTQQLRAMTAQASTFEPSAGPARGAKSAAFAGDTGPVRSAHGLLARVREQLSAWLRIGAN